jgi:hypothetical protein
MIMSILVEGLVWVALRLGVLIQRITLAAPTQERLATCPMVGFTFSQTSKPYSGMISDMHP